MRARCVGETTTMSSINRCLRLGIAVLAGCAFAAVQAAEAPLSAIRAGRLVDVTNGRVVTDQVILVRGDRIEAVGVPDAVTIPAGTNVIDLSAYTVLPGRHSQRSTVVLRCCRRSSAMECQCRELR